MRNKKVTTHVIYSDSISYFLIISLNIDTWAIIRLFVDINDKDNRSLTINHGACWVNRFLGFGEGEKRVRMSTLKTIIFSGRLDTAIGLDMFRLRVSIGCRDKSLLLIVRGVESMPETLRSISPRIKLLVIVINTFDTVHCVG